MATPHHPGGSPGPGRSGGTAVAGVLTATWFPARYWALVKTFDPLATWALLARNLTLICLLVVLLRDLAKLERPTDGLDR